VGWEAELDDILRELLREPGAVGVSLARAETSEAAEGPRFSVPLGEGIELRVTTTLEPPVDLANAAERAVRELRACLRRSGVSLASAPEVSLWGRVPRSRAALLERVTRLLEALAANLHATAVTVLRGDGIVASAGALDEVRRERLTFLRKRVDAEAARKRGTSSHAEVVSPDVYARSFWFDAYLALFFDHAYSVDFARHRARIVAREIGRLLPHLDDDPDAPAVVKPLPR